MKTVEALGMKRPVCASCFEYPENCVGCEWNRCYKCGEELADNECYEYRGAFSCSEHLEEVSEAREIERKEVMQEMEASVKSQMGGQWMSGGYKTMKADPHTGKPIGKVKESLRIQQYEGRV